MYTLPETELMKVHAVEETDRSGTYVIEPLFPGYGITVGNSLRRVLFSSLYGSAISSVRIDGATHEFATLPGMIEDVVTLILNLKTLRIKLLTDEPATLRLEAKGPGAVRAKDFIANANVVVVDPEHYLATLDKQGKLSMEVTVERGRGYVPTEQKMTEHQPLGTISVDSIFTPVKKVHYEVENTRVGDMTNFDKLTIDITTDGTVEPRAALEQAAKILVEHFDILSQTSSQTGKRTEVAIEAVENMTEETTETIKPKRATKKAKAEISEKTDEKPAKKTRKATK